jgi:plastocyanin
MAALTALAMVLLIGSAGCGAQGGKSTASSTPPAAEKGGSANAGSHAATRTGKTTPARAASAPGASRIRLSQAGCIQFEPHWMDLEAGKSVTWTSELATPVTIHVTAGAFDKTEFVIRPGQTVSSGPARTPGTYSFWSEPGACQGVPRGVRGAGPGLTVTGRPTS